MRLFRGICRKQRIANVFAVFFLIVAGCSPEPAEDAGQKTSTADERKPQKLIVALGDSLTEGLGIDEDKTYPALLERKLRENGLDYRVVNAGVSGETTAGTLSRISWILSMNPDWVILETGANDGLRGLDPELAAENIRKIIGKLREANVGVILAGMKMFQSQGAEYSEKFNAIYPHLAESENVPLIPFFLEGVAGKRELNLDDGIHPNEQGYRIIVESIYPLVVPHLDTPKAN